MEVSQRRDHACDRDWERNGPKSLLVGGLVLAAIGALLTTISVQAIPPRNEYMDLADSETPLDNIQPERKRLVVELIRRTAANSEEENKALLEAQKTPIKPPVYSPESFANQEVITATMTQLNKYANIDFDYFLKQQSARQEFRKKMALSDPAYLGSWDDARREQETIEADTNRLEHDWLTSVTSLYAYATQNIRVIEVRDGKLAIADPSVLQTFNEKLKNSKELNAELQSSVQSQSKRQQELRARIPGS